jgi:hypothetical protein
MAELQDRIQNVLDETRMLILGGEVMLGFSSRAVLEPGFKELSAVGKASCAVSMGLLACSIGLFMLPVAYHRIVWRGEDRIQVHQFASGILCWALLPFAIAISSGVFAVGERTRGTWAGWIIALFLVVCAIAAWYVFPAIARRTHSGKEPDVNDEKETTPLSQKIKHVLTECRMVLPGAQALLGFGSIAVLFNEFMQLPEILKVVHVAGLCSIAIAVVLLMTPAAYHRIVEKGDESESFHRVATRLLLCAMAMLALGMAAAVWIVFDRVTDSRAAGALAGSVVVIAFLGAWFGWTTLQRRKREAKK